MPVIIGASKKTEPSGEVWILKMSKKIKSPDRSTLRSELLITRVIDDLYLLTFTWFAGLCQCKSGSIGMTQAMQYAVTILHFRDNV